MPFKTADIKLVVLVMVGVYLAGRVMNATRTNPYVLPAIAGYDA